MAETGDERESAPLMVKAGNEQPDTSSLTAAANMPLYSLQTTIHQNATLVQPNLPTPPTTANRPSMYTGKIILKINGNLTEMTERWTEEEQTNHRRIVWFTKFRDGDILNVYFRAVPIHERPHHSVCISCIWWEEKSDYYITQVDVIHLIERLVKVSDCYTVPQKNRLRRKFDGFNPVMVSKGNSPEFFKTVMAYGHPKPRNIETDFKVFPWSCFESMLKKVIGKYSYTQPEVYNAALGNSIGHGNIPQRERGPNAQNTSVSPSNLPGTWIGRPETYLTWVENTLFNILKDLDADEDVRERLLGVVPDLLGAFALKIGYSMPAHAHRDATYFVQKYRQEVDNPQE